MRCFHCGNEIFYTDRVGIREECEKCKSDVHCCRNCAFYDPKVYNECKEPQAEVIREKDRANVCDYFRKRLSVQIMTLRELFDFVVRKVSVNVYINLYKQWKKNRFIYIQ